MKPPVDVSELYRRIAELEAAIIYEELVYGVPQFHCALCDEYVIKEDGMDALVHLLSCPMYRGPFRREKP